MDERKARELTARIAQWDACHAAALRPHIGTGAGFERFCVSGETDISNASRAIEDGLRQEGYRSAQAPYARMEKGGEAFVSNAVVQGRYLLRPCIVNFNTGESDVEEIQVLGDWAFMRCRLRVDMTREGRTSTRSGYTLTVLRKGRDGIWRIARDANLLT